MGWWGFNSDQNDNTYNEIGISIPDRIFGTPIPEDLTSKMNQRLADLHKGLQADPNLLDRDPIYVMAAFVGICRLLLSHGMRIDLPHLEAAIGYARILMEDKEHIQCFTEPDTRLKALQDEIAGFEDAIANSGTSDFFGKSETLVGIMESAMEEDDDQA